MKKRDALFTILLVGVFFISFVSAGWFSDGWNFITGKVTASEEFYLDSTLRGPATYEVASADCIALGMRLPTWEEASWDLNNQVSTLTNGNSRIWTSKGCSGARFATAYSGLRNLVESGKDPGAKKYYNNCNDKGGKASYQCVAVKAQAPVTPTCNSNEDCTDSELPYCNTYDNVCTNGDNGNGCTSSNDCYFGFCDESNKCSDGSKGSTCSVDSQCNNMLCTDGHCSDRTIGSSCVVNSDCDSNLCSDYICQESQTVPVSSLKQEEFGPCSSNDECISDLCNPETNECASIPCGSDSDCASGFVCDQSLSNCVPSSNVVVPAVIQSSCPDLAATNGLLFDEIGGYVLVDVTRLSPNSTEDILGDGNFFTSSYVYSNEAQDQGDALLVVSYSQRLFSTENISGLSSFQGMLKKAIWNLGEYKGSKYYDFKVTGKTKLISYLVYTNGNSLVTISLYSQDKIIDTSIARDAIQSYMDSCPSTEIQSTCNPQWSKSYGSVVCPASGINTVLWHDENGCEVDFTKDVDCTSGDCSGCNLDGKCYPIGYRSDSSYCDSVGFKEQKTESSSCNNNFECSTNVCVNGSCISMGLWEKFLFWFQSIFGTGLTKTLEVSL